MYLGRICGQSATRKDTPVLQLEKFNKLKIQILENLGRRYRRRLRDLLPLRWPLYLAPPAVVGGKPVLPESRYVIRPLDRS